MGSKYSCLPSKRVSPTTDKSHRRFGRFWRKKEREKKRESTSLLFCCSGRSSSVDVVSPQEAPSAVHGGAKVEPCVIAVHDDSEVEPCVIAVHGDSEVDPCVIAVQDVSEVEPCTMAGHEDSTAELVSVASTPSLYTESDSFSYTEDLDSSNISEESDDEFLTVSFSKPGVELELQSVSSVSLDYDLRDTNLSADLYGPLTSTPIDVQAGDCDQAEDSITLEDINQERPESVGSEMLAANRSLATTRRKLREDPVMLSLLSAQVLYRKRQNWQKKLTEQLFRKGFKASRLAGCRSVDLYKPNRETSSAISSPTHSSFLRSLSAPERLLPARPISSDDSCKRATIDIVYDAPWESQDFSTFTDQEGMVDSSISPMDDAFHSTRLGSGDSSVSYLSLPDTVSPDVNDGSDRSNVSDMSDMTIEFADSNVSWHREPIPSGNSTSSSPRSRFSSPSPNIGYPMPSSDSSRSSYGPSIFQHGASIFQHGASMFPSGPSIFASGVSLSPSGSSISSSGSSISPSCPSIFPSGPSIFQHGASISPSGSSISPSGPSIFSYGPSIFASGVSISPSGSSISSSASSTSQSGSSSTSSGGVSFYRPPKL